MNTMFDISPLWRSTIGFDRLFDILDEVTKTDDSGSFPPYNIEQTGDDAYCLTMALAGWSPAEINMTAQPNVLVVAGEKTQQDNNRYLYQGIPGGSFERRFELADHVQVRDARMAEGMLIINLVREVPEALKPRRIEIANNDNQQPAIEQKKQAA